MAEAYIIDAVRTPVGKRGGGLSQVHPADLGAFPLTKLFERIDVDPAAVEDVIFGCLDAIGPQAGDIARTCWLAAGLPEEVPGTTIDRQCGSSQQAVHFAAQAVMSGTADLIVAGGVQNMSTIPISSAMTVAEPMGYTDPFSGSKGWQARYGDQEISQFRGADLIAEKWGITREDMEVFALESHRRAAQATDEGRFEREIVPFEGVTADEGFRRDTSLEKMATLKTLREDGRITAAVSSQISDAGAAMLIASEQAVKPTTASRRGPASTTSACAAPTRCSCCRRRSPPPPTPWPRRACPSTTSTWSRSTRPSPRSCWPGRRRPAPTWPRSTSTAGPSPSATRSARPACGLMTTLLNELERTGGRYGLQTMCEGGGQANVTIIERL